MELETKGLWVKGKGWEYPEVKVIFPLDIAFRETHKKEFFRQHPDFIPYKQEISNPYGIGKWIIRELILFPLRVLGFKRPPPILPAWAGDGKDHHVDYSLMHIGLRKDPYWEGKEVR